MLSGAKTLGCALLGAVALAAPAARATVIDGSYSIVVPNYDRSGLPGDIVKAARHFAAALKEGTELDLPVVFLARHRQGPAIYLGIEAATNAGFRIEGGRDFSNVIAEKDGSVYLFGNDRALHPGIGRNGYMHTPIPTLKALVRFMEKYLDVRFLAPGETGWDVPKVEKVEVPAGTYDRQDPVLEFCPPCFGGRDPLYDMASGMFGRGRFYTYGGHTYPKACPPSKYFKEHPEYFGLVGGRRVGVPEGNPTLCISNPAVEDLIVAEMKRRYEEGNEVVQLAQQDGWQYCECANCKEFEGGEGTDLGEKIWRFHRRIAERIERECPGRIVHILCYSATLKPPKTFRKFPSNVMIELCHVSRAQLEEWRGYDVPQGFTAYIYLWGGYQPLGFTAKRSYVRCHDFAKMLVEYPMRGIYRCGYGELFGLEGPAYWVFNRTLENPAADVEALVDEYCRRAYGPECAESMRRFHDYIDRRLRGVNLMEGDMDFGAISPGRDCRDARPGNALEELAFVYSPDVTRLAENRLRVAERAVVGEKRRKRLALVRTQFDYAKNLGHIAVLYGAFRIAPSKATLAPLLDAVDERNRMLDDFFKGGVRGLARSPEGWPEVLVIGARDRDSLMTNGRLLATLGAPVTWDTEILRKSGQLPGAFVRTCTVPRVAAAPAGMDFESGEWAKAGWNDLAGLQLERFPQKARFKLLAGPTALHLAVESDLADKDVPVAMEHDARLWSIENLDLMIAPHGGTNPYYHFVFGPHDQSVYDAAYGLVTDPLDPYFRKPDERWNSSVTAHNAVGGGTWRVVIDIPYADLKARAPKAGDVWRFNLGRDTNKNRRPRRDVQLLWNPNLMSRSFIAPDAMGRLVFGGEMENQGKGKRNE